MENVELINNEQNQEQIYVKSSFKKTFKKDKETESTSNFEERIIKVKRISKTTKGGRIMRFSALVVIGDRNGTVGFAMAKSNEVPDAIKKAIKKANNNLFKIKMNKNKTVYHEVLGKHGASSVLLKPAKQGKGIVAGDTIRAVVELAGFHDVYTKSLGSNVPVNVIQATIKGLQSQFSPKEIANNRDKEISEL